MVYVTCRVTLPSHGWSASASRRRAILGARLGAISEDSVRELWRFREMRRSKCPPFSIHVIQSKWILSSTPCNYCNFEIFHPFPSMGMNRFMATCSYMDGSCINGVKSYRSSSPHGPHLVPMALQCGHGFRHELPPRITAPAAAHRRRRNPSRRQSLRRKRLGPNPIQSAARKTWYQKPHKKARSSTVLRHTAYSSVWIWQWQPVSCQGVGWCALRGPRGPRIFSTSLCPPRSPHLGAPRAELRRDRRTRAEAEGHGAQLFSIAEGHVMRWGAEGGTWVQNIGGFLPEKGHAMRHGFLCIVWWRAGHETDLSFLWLIRNT